MKIKNGYGSKSNRSTLIRVDVSLNDYLERLTDEVNKKQKKRLSRVDVSRALASALNDNDLVAAKGLRELEECFW